MMAENKRPIQSDDWKAQLMKTSQKKSVCRCCRQDDLIGASCRSICLEIFDENVVAIFYADDSL